MDELNVKLEELLTPEQLKQHKLREEYNDNNINGFSMPIKINRDSDYLNSLTENINRYYDFNSKVNYNEDSVFYGKLSFADFDNHLVNKEHLTQQI